MKKEEEKKQQKTDRKRFVDYVKPIKMPLIALLLWFCFEELITKSLLSFNEKWMADCNEQIGGVLILVLLLFLMWYLHEKCQKTMLSVCHIGWLFFFIYIYVFYRWFNDTFYFWGFSIGSKHIAYTDFCILPFIQLVYQQIRIICKKQKLCLEGQCLIDKDEPLGCDDEDLFEYGTIIRSLLTDLNYLDLSKHSYSIGVTGEWGIGKSSFFNLLKKELGENAYKDKSVIVEFNPRSSSDIKEIQQDFFNRFADELSQYHSGIARDMQRYQDALQLPESNFVVRLMRLLPSLTVSKSKGTINSVIKDISRRVYVLVDDFDRLTAQEILEVMKVIDRNGDFCETIFITAYDKEYVNNVLKNYLKHRKKDTFSDKYFNYEISLPIQPKEVLIKYVRDSIAKKLNDDEGDAITISQMQSEWDKIALPIVEKLRTLRHVKRFLNIFLSRYSKVKNDVVFGDFVRVSLLRYYDINCYHALVEGKLTIGGGIISTNVLYRAVDLDEKLRRYSNWEGSSDLISELFDEQRDNDYNYTPKYKRLQFIRSFPCYFFDYQPNGVYYKQLISLYDAATDDDAIDYLHKLIKYDKEKKRYDQSAYVAVENFLRVRPITELRNEKEVMRLFNLLCYLNGFMWRSVNIEGSLHYMMGRGCSNELLNNMLIQSEEWYKQKLKESIITQITKKPINIGFILLQLGEALRSPNTIESDYLFKREEIQELSEICQKSYLDSLDDNTNYNYGFVIAFSKVYDLTRTDGGVSETAKREFVSYISNHVDQFVKGVIKVMKTHSEKPKLNIRFIEEFIPADFFPCDGMDINQWVKKYVASPYLAYVFNRLLKESSRTVVVNLDPKDYGINEQDYKRAYEVLKKSDDLIEEEKVKNAMKHQVANSIELLAKQTKLHKDNVRAALMRLKEKGDISDTEANVAEKIPAFEKGDIVRLKDSALNKYERMEWHVINLYDIYAIESDMVKLTDVNGIVSIDDIEAVPIDGSHDKKIYYEPIVVSVNGSGGAVTTDYSYYMKALENSEDEEGKKYCDIIKEKNFHFVHEVQHWLREIHIDDGLQILPSGY